MRYPSSCVRNFPVCSGSLTARDQDMACDWRHAPYCLPTVPMSSASRMGDFAVQWLACRFPLSTIRHAPHDACRMTRGRNDSLFLFRIELSSTISYQFVLAHWHLLNPTRHASATLSVKCPSPSANHRAPVHRTVLVPFVHTAKPDYSPVPSPFQGEGMARGTGGVDWVGVHGLR